MQTSRQNKGSKRSKKPKLLDEKDASEALLAIRDKLDTVDRRLVDVIAERINLVQKVADIKTYSNRKLRDIPREEDLLTKVVEYGRTQHIDTYLLTRIFQEILEHSVRLQLGAITEAHNPVLNESQQTVAFQGMEGSYSYAAAQRHFSAGNKSTAFRGYKTLSETLDSVLQKKSDVALLPIENTVAGSLNETYDLLTKANLSFVGEEVLQINYCLLATHTLPLHRIRVILAHPQALTLCSDFISRMDCKVESFADSAMAARSVHEQGDRSIAAIASEQAAKLYGLRVLSKNIANQKEHFTRYVIVAREPVTYDMRIPCKTSVIFATGHEQGALLRCLDVFAQHQLSFTKLESRPKPESAWEYMFYADFEGNIADPNVQTAVEQLRNRTTYLRVLGSYPSRTTPESMPAKPRSKQPAHV